MLLVDYVKKILINFFISFIKIDTNIDIDHAQVKMNRFNNKKLGKKSCDQMTRLTSN